LALDFDECQQVEFPASAAPIHPSRDRVTDDQPIERVPERIASMSISFRPLADRVVVKRIEAEQKTAGGIIIPGTAQEKPQEGEIVAVGPGARDDAGKLIALDVKVGDKVLFGKWSGTEIKLGGQDLLIMKESDILGIVG
jgi:chaperonin GroES